ncbi:hypothetical protein LOZ58_006303 [Ophidiomyces ophidiicola]|nr:hypothetical protein LOZ58_006303 [Ophidiomyces ophidiicola]
MSETGLVDKHGDLVDEPTIIDLKFFPSTFILPIHLTLSELHRFEETVVRCGAPLTYDIAEAHLILGKVSHKKRAALELRTRALWTDDICDNADSSLLPPNKKPRLENPSVVDGEHAEAIHDQAIAEPKGVASPGESPGDKPTLQAVQEVLTPQHIYPSLSSLRDDDVRVIKLDWLHESLAAGHALPLAPFTVYHARKVARPDTSPSLKIFPRGAGSFSSTLSHARENNTHQILERAKADAATAPPPRFNLPSTKYHRGKLGLGDSQSLQKARSKMYRKTTPEHEQVVSIPIVPGWVEKNVLHACLRSAPLHPPNEQFINQLLKIKQIRELTLDEIGVRAYSTSIASLAAYPYLLQTPEQVLALPGCESRIANWFSEWKQSSDGTVQAANQLDTDPVLSTLKLFSNIWGIGAKTAREFYYHKNWRCFDDIIDNGWNNLSRVQQIGVKYYDEFLEGIPRAEVKSIADIVLEHARKSRPDSHYDGKGIEAILVGGYRRGKERCGDVDIILTHRDENVTHDLIYDVISSLEQGGYIPYTLSLNLASSHRDQQPLPYRGETSKGRFHFDTLDKALVVWQDPHFEGSSLDLYPSQEPKELDDNEHISQSPQSGTDNHISATLKPVKTNPNPHRRVDIIISPWRTIGCAVLGWSGDTTFERDLRRYVKKTNNWKFDSSGIRAREGSGGRVIDLESNGKTWQERERLVMEGLGVGWRPPEERCTR